jgi:hypothetical protein
LLVSVDRPDGEAALEGCYRYLRVLPLMKESHVPGKLAVRNITQGCDEVTFGTPCL